MTRRHWHTANASALRSPQRSQKHTADRWHFWAADEQFLQMLQDVVYAIGGQGNQGKAVHPSIERLDGERFVLLPQQMQAERKYVSATAFAGTIEQATKQMGSQTCLF
jgi:hypothetical protein